MYSTDKDAIICIYEWFAQDHYMLCDSTELILMQVGNKENIQKADRIYVVLVMFESIIDSLSLGVFPTNHCILEFWNYNQNCHQKRIKQSKNHFLLFI